jgi:hypothetical protein
MLRLPDGPDRVHLRTFAIWKVQHDLARTERQGRIKRTSQHFARTKIRVSTDLLLWLSEQHMALLIGTILLYEAHPMRTSQITPNTQTSGQTLRPRM